MKPREFHLFDFPNNIYINLNPKFRIKLFDNAISKIGNKTNLAKYLKREIININFWVAGYRIMYNKKYPEFIPLKVLKKLSQLLNISQKQFEEKIISYKSRGSRFEIKYPKLPIIEKQDIARILAHFIGDGSDTKNFYYYNKEKQLHLQIKRDLKLFGDVHTNLKYYKSRKLYYLNIPKVIPNLLKHFYKIEFGTFKSRVPKSFFKLPNSFTSEFLKAYIDDEGDLSNERIRMTSANLLLLKDLRRLIKIKFPSINTTLSKKKNNCYKLIIYANSLENFVTLIGYPYHPIKRIKFISYLERIKYRRSLNGKRTKRYETKSKILDYIRNDRYCKTHDLSKDFKITEYVIKEHLKMLEDTGLIKSFRESGKSPKIWRINNGFR